MNTSLETSFEPAVSASLPNDLTAWMPPSSLAQLAREAAETFYWIEADEDDSPFGGCHCPLRKLSLLTYCFALRVYTMREIESRMATDPLAQHLCANAIFEQQKLQLFRGQNRDLLTLTVAYVLQRAWEMRTPPSDFASPVLSGRNVAAWRAFFAQEAEQRVERSFLADNQTLARRASDSQQLLTDQRAASPSPLNGERAGVRGENGRRGIVGDEIGHLQNLSIAHASEYSHPSPSIPLPVEGRGRPAPAIAGRATVSSPRRATHSNAETLVSMERRRAEDSVALPSVSILKLLTRTAVAVLVGCALLLIGWPALAADVYESFTFDGRVYKQARLVEATPVDLLFVIDGPMMGLRIKRQELPPELKEKYPYDPLKAAEFEREKAAKAKAQQEQQRRDIYQTLLRQEKETQAKIDATIEELAKVQKEIKNWRARPNVPPKARMIDQLVQKRMDLDKHIDWLRKQLEVIRQQQGQYR